MERIETINLKTETDALEAGHGITLYTFDEYGRLIHYAHIVASTPKEREDGYADYFLTIFKGGDDMRRFDPEGGQVERDARTIAEAETRPYVPSLFDLFEESIVEGGDRLESDGVEREARNAWERGMYREMLHAMKD